MEVNFNKKDAEVMPGVYDTDILSNELIKNSFSFFKFIVDNDVRDAKVAGKACYDMLVEEHRQMQKELYGKELTQEELEKYRNSRKCRSDWASLMSIAREMSAEDYPAFLEFVQKRYEEKKRFGNG